MLDGEALRYAERNGELARGAVHRADIGDIDDGRLIAQMFERDVRQIEMNVFEKKVSGDEYLGIIVFEHCGIVADTFFR